MQTSTIPAQHPLQRRWARRLFILAACLGILALLFFVVAQPLLISRMRLPRLTLPYDGIVMNAALMPDGRTIFGGGDPSYSTLHLRHNPPADVFVWDASTGHLLRRLHGLYWRAYWTTASPDGKYVVAHGHTAPDLSSRSPTRVIGWDWQTGKQVWRGGEAYPLSFSPDGKKLGSGSSIYEVANGKRLCQTSPHMAEEAGSAFTPNGRLFGLVDDRPSYSQRRSAWESDDIRVAYAGNFLRLWRTDTGQHVRDYPFIRARSFAFAQDGQWLVVVCDRGQTIGGPDGSIVRRVDFATGKALWAHEQSTNGPDPDPDAQLNSVAISPNGKYVVVQSFNSRLIVLDARTGRELFRPFVHQAQGELNWWQPGGVAFSADGRTLVSRCGRSVLVWDASSLR